MLKSNSTNAAMEKAGSKSRKKNVHVDTSVGGRAKEALPENSRNTPDRKTNTMQKTRETKVTEKDRKRKKYLHFTFSVTGAQTAVAWYQLK